MKNNAASSAKSKEGTVKAVETGSDNAIILMDEAKSGDTLYRIRFDLYAFAEALGLTDDMGITVELIEGLGQLARLALRTLCHRNPKGKASLYPIGKDDKLPEVADVTLENFVKAIQGVSFQGEAKPTKADTENAKAIMAAIKANPAREAKIAEGLQGLYKRPAPEMVMDSLERFFMNVRLDAERAKNETLANLLGE